MEEHCAPNDIIFDDGTILCRFIGCVLGSYGLELRYSVDIETKLAYFVVVSVDDGKPSAPMFLKHMRTVREAADGELVEVPMLEMTDAELAQDQIDSLSDLIEHHAQKTWSDWTDLTGGKKDVHDQ